MGLLSFIFGGGKSKAPPPKPSAKAMKPVEKAVAAKTSAKAAEKAPAKAVAAKPATGLTVLRLKADYAAAVRAGEHRKAYATACELAALYKRAGSRALAGAYRKAADAKFAKVVGASGARVKSRGSLRLVGEAQAGLILAHRDFLAGFKDAKRAA